MKRKMSQSHCWQLHIVTHWCKVKKKMRKKNKKKKKKNTLSSTAYKCVWMVVHVPIHPTHVYWVWEWKTSYSNVTRILFARRFIYNSPKNSENTFGQLLFFTISTLGRFNSCLFYFVLSNQLYEYVSSFKILLDEKVKKRNKRNDKKQETRQEIKKRKKEKNKVEEKKKVERNK